MLSNRQYFLNHLAQTSDSPLSLEITKAEGIYIYDVSGKRYTDLISGISVSNTGHRHPTVLKAIKDQADTYLHLMVYGEYIQSPQVQLAAQLTALLPESLNNCYFVNSGSEAVEGALKLARRFTGRKNILAFHNAYHGSTMGSLSLIGDSRYREPFGPLIPGVKHTDFNSDAAFQYITSETACVIAEPVQGEAGVIPGTREFLEGLRKRCTDTGALLIFDESQTGLGRTGYRFAFEHYGVVPDILILSKGLGGGMPLGAFISSKNVMNSLTNNPVLGHITTFGGHPVCCAAALANLEVIRTEKLIETAEQKGLLFENLLSGISAVAEIRRAGLMIALQLDSYAHTKRVIDYCIGRGVITDWFLFNDSSMRIAPPLIITEEQIRESCAIIRDGLENA
jgi:acetylornithine/N-succinyldiaminopimelate aminotransferase